MNSQFTGVLAVSLCVNSLVICINLITAFHQPIPQDSCAVPEPHPVLHLGYSSLLHWCLWMLSVTTYISTLFQFLVLVSLKAFYMMHQTTSLIWGWVRVSSFTQRNFLHYQIHASFVWHDCNLCCILSLYFTLYLFCLLRKNNLSFASHWGQVN